MHPQEEQLQETGAQLSTSRAALQAAQAAEQAMLARATAAEDRARQLDVQYSDLQLETEHTTYEPVDRTVDRIVARIVDHHQGGVC